MKPLTPTEVMLLKQSFRYMYPDWGTAGKVHDWRNHVDEDVQEIWDTFTLEQRVILGQQHKIGQTGRSGSGESTRNKNRVTYSLA